MNQTLTKLILPPARFFDPQAGGWRDRAKIRIAGFLLAAVLVFFATPLCAISREWTGAVSANWSEPNNWNPAGIPQNGDGLVFDVDDAPHRSMVNDLPNLSVNFLNFLEDQDYALSGNSLTFTNTIIFNPFGSATLTINCSLVAQAIPGRFTSIHAQPQNGLFSDNTGNLHLNGSITITNGQLLIQADGTDGSFASGIGHIYISSTFSGTNDVVAVTLGPNNGASVEFDGPLGNLFIGGLILDTDQNSDSRIIFNSPSGIVSDKIMVIGGIARLNLNQPIQMSAVEISTRGQLFLFGNNSTISNLFMRGIPLENRTCILDTGSTTVTIQNAITNRNDNSVNLPAIKGKISFPAGVHNIVLTGTNSPGLDMQAQISGAGGLIKSGDATLMLESSNTFSGLVFVTQGVCDVRNSHALGSTSGGTYLTSGGVLTLRNAAVSGESLFVQGNQVITPDTTGSLLDTIGTCSWLGPIVLDSSLMVIADDLTLGGPISSSGGLELQYGNALIASSGADNTYTGTTFVHCPLAKFDNVSHKAFSGPLVVGSVANIGSCEARWLAGSQSPTNTLTVYSNGIVNLNNFSDSFKSISFSGGLVESGSGILTLSQDITCAASAAAATVNGQLSLVSGNHNFVVNNGAVLPDLTVNALISGSGGITKKGTGEMLLTGPNTYAGATEVDNGLLIAANDHALGATTSGTTVLSTGTLEVDGLTSIFAEPLVVQGTGWDGISGALNCKLSSTISSPMTLIAPTTIRNDDTNGQFLIFSTISNIGSPTPLTKAGLGTLNLGGNSANTYSGDTTVSAGSLWLSKPSSTAAVPGNLVIGPASGAQAIAALFGSSQIGGDTVTVDANSLLNLNNYSQTLAHLNLNDGGSVQTGGGNLNFSGSGTVAVGSLSVLGSRVASSISGIIGLPANDTVTFAVNRFNVISVPAPTGPELDVSAFIPAPVENGAFAPAGITKNGPGQMRLSANNAYKGASFINAGTLRIDGSQPRGLIFVDGGILGGSGTVGKVYPEAGSAIVAPGASPGILTCSNFNVGASGPGTLQMELNGTTAGSGYDQLNVHGIVNLAGITLNGSLNFTSAVSNQFTIINNDGSDPVTGTFNGLAQNASFYIGGESFSINYTGGDGNDVVLTRAVTPSKPSLTIQSVPPASVRLLWPTNDPAYSLQSNTNLATNNWSSVSPPPVIAGTNNTVTNTTSSGPKFYRLFKP